jgi:hypothetical protein
MYSVVRRSCICQLVTYVVLLQFSKSRSSSESLVELKKYPCIVNEHQLIACIVITA